MTYSIVARDPDTGELGVGVQTHRPAVGAGVPWVEPGVGGIATQSMANVGFGPQALELLKNGLDAPLAMRAILAGDRTPEIRQVGIVDAQGKTASHTGESCIPAHGAVEGENFSTQANMMLNPGVPEAMAGAFTRSPGRLVDRILAAMEAAQSAGGDIRGMQSAAIKVMPARSNLDMPRVGVPPRGTWDFRTDNSANPNADLRRLIDIKSAEAMLVTDDAYASIEATRAAYSKAAALAHSDELDFWHAVRGLSGKFEAHEEAADVLEPLFSRAPQWLELLHRLPELPKSSPLRTRFPRS